MLAAGRAAKSNANAQAFGNLLEGATKIGGLYYQQSLFEKYGTR